MDSAACVHLLQKQGYEIKGIFIDFGQAAVKQERKAVKKVSEFFDIQTTTLVAQAASGYGAGELVGRNAFLVTTAIFLGRVDRGLLAIGVHSGTPYYDCSAGFVARMKQLAEEHTDGRLTVSAPFVDWNKAQIHDYCVRAKIPIKSTYSCESGTIPPCGSCASCRDRKELGC